MGEDTVGETELKITKSAPVANRPGLAFASLPQKCTKGIKINEILSCFFVAVGSPAADHHERRPEKRMRPLLEQLQLRRTQPCGR